MTSTVHLRERYQWQRSSNFVAGPGPFSRPGDIVLGRVIAPYIYEIVSRQADLFALHHLSKEEDPHAERRRLVNVVAQEQL